MGLYVDLNASDKAIVDNTTNLIRAMAGELFRQFNHRKAVGDDTNAVSLITGLDTGEVIPNSSGLSGADDLTREELIAIYTTMSTIQTTYDTASNRAAASKAAGINTLLG